MDWRSLYFGRVTKAEVAEAINDAEWQRLRITMKGAPLPIKYKMMCHYRDVKLGADPESGAHEVRMLRVRLTNYVTALARGGLLKREEYRDD